MPDFNEVVDIVFEVVAQWTPRVLGSLLLLIGGWLIAGRMKRLATKALHLREVR